MIAEDNYTDTGLENLLQLSSDSDSETVMTLGKNIVGKIKGKDIHIGDHVYQQWDGQAIEALTFIEVVKKAVVMHSNKNYRHSLSCRHIC